MDGEAWVMPLLHALMICLSKGIGQSNDSWVGWCQRFRLLDTKTSKPRDSVVGTGGFLAGLVT